MRSQNEYRVVGALLHGNFRPEPLQATAPSRLRRERPYPVIFEPALEAHEGGVLTARSGDIGVISGKAGWGVA
jgi:hypothetical protein